jgi:hypothetical protein
MSVHINKAQETFELLLKTVEELKTVLKKNDPNAIESVKKYIRSMVDTLGDHLERDIDLAQYISNR